MKTASHSRVFAGTLVLLSLALTYILHPWWLTLAAFVGFNLIQSEFSGFCMAEFVWRKLRWAFAAHRPPPQ